jgi:hypothetical protein
MGVRQEHPDVNIAVHNIPDLFLRMNYPCKRECRTLYRNLTATEYRDQRHCRGCSAVGSRVYLDRRVSIYWPNRLPHGTNIVILQFGAHYSPHETRSVSALARTMSQVMRVG